MKEISSMIQGNIYERHYRKFKRPANPIRIFSDIHVAMGVRHSDAELIIMDFGDPDRSQLEYWKRK